MEGVKQEAMEPTYQEKVAWYNEVATRHLKAIEEGAPPEEIALLRTLLNFASKSLTEDG